ncbi:MAG TPA: ABC transporter permease, partial [Limnochordia bacterium]
MWRGYARVVAMSFKAYWRDRMAVFWGIAFPLLLMGLIGAVFGRSDQLAVTISLPPPAEGSGTAGLSPSGLRDALASALGAIDGVTLLTEPREEGLQALRRGERTALVDVPDRLPGSITVHYDEGRPEVAAATLAIIGQVVAQIDRQLSGRPALLTVAPRPVSAQQLSMFDFLLPGILAMTLMQTGLMGVTWVIADYRERLVLKRVLATPIHPFAFLAGIVSRFTVINLLQGVIIYLVATYAFGARTVGSLAALALLAVIGSVVFLAMGFAISTISKTAEAANGLGSLVNFPMLFLSGTFWPRELMPAAMRPLIDALPLTPLVDAMRGVATRADALSAHWP